MQQGLDLTPPSPYLYPLSYSPPWRSLDSTQTWLCLDLSPHGLSAVTAAVQYSSLDSTLPELCATCTCPLSLVGRRLGTATTWRCKNSASPQLSTALLSFPHGSTDFLALTRCIPLPPPLPPPHSLLISLCLLIPSLRAHEGAKLRKLMFLSHWCG